MITNLAPLGESAIQVDITEIRDEIKNSSIEELDKIAFCQRTGIRRGLELRIRD